MDLCCVAVGAAVALGRLRMRVLTLATIGVAAFSGLFVGQARGQSNEIVHAVSDPSPVANIVSSSAGPNPFSGLTINIVVGADRFYNAGFIGSAATVANVEAGHIWNGHESLQHVTTFVQDAVSPGPQTGEFDRHATWVGAVLGGRPALPFPGDYQVGMAPGADLWSASISTTWIGPPYTGGFDINLNSFANPYKTVMVTGVNGRTADVINSSWGFSEPTGAGSDFARAIDALVSISGKTFVTVAGNEGPAGDTVESPAAAYNKIAVGALTSDTSIPPFGMVADFSSRGPSDVLNPITNQVKIGVRATVDIAAPGTDFTLAYYGGADRRQQSVVGANAGDRFGQQLLCLPVGRDEFCRANRGGRSDTDCGCRPNFVWAFDQRRGWPRGEGCAVEFRRQDRRLE